MTNCKLPLVTIAVLVVLSVEASHVYAQSFGVELHNTVMPASGGMAGVSVARPQDLTSAINANPATLTQFHGTQFLFGGAWIEPTINLQHDGGVLPNIGNFAAKSEAQGSAAGNIGVTQDLSALGLPATFGLGFTTAGGGAADFNDVAASNGTSSSQFILEITSAMGIDVTDRLSVGGSVSLGTGFYDGPFVGISSMAYDYALRGSAGMTYLVAPQTTFGFYYQSKQGFTFDDAIRLELAPAVFDPIVRDIKMELPANLGFGIANSSLMDGRLLLAVDVLYKFWESADLYRAVYDNQFVVQTGAQFSSGRVRYRLGYAYAENPLKNIPNVTVGGVNLPGPFALASVHYLQAQLAITNLHRISAGIGIQDVLPGIDFDLAAGGMFESSQDFGNFTSASVESYWIALGMTWHFGRGACENGQWCYE